MARTIDPPSALPIDESAARAPSDVAVQDFDVSKLSLTELTTLQYKVENMLRQRRATEALDTYEHMLRNKMHCPLILGAVAFQLRRELQGMKRAPFIDEYLDTMEVFTS